MKFTQPDLAIIGSGSGNTLITPFWDDKQVVMFERNTEFFGGTCLNVGCIPTKMFVRSADAARSPEEAARLNVTQETTAVDWQGIRDRVFGRIDPISEGGKRYRAEELENVELISDTAILTGGTGVRTPDGREMSPKQLVIAAGSRPRLPEIPGVDLPGVHTSDTVMRMDTLPERIMIVGGGFIACEFASIFSGLGASVVQTNRSGQLMKGMDSEIGVAYTDAVSKQWEIHDGLEPKAIRQNGDRLVYVASSLNGQPDREFEVDAILFAIGRVPNTDLLGAEAAGFDLHRDGRLAVDEYQRVLANGEPVPGVWALGDISSPHQLKHVANHEARVVGHNMENPHDLQRSDTMPVVSATFTHPELARVGLTEVQAKEQFGEENILVKVQRYGDTAFGWALEDSTGLFKIVAEKSTGKILGADVMGYQASNIIQPVVMAMSFGIDAKTAARGQYWPHPALSEVAENAMLGLFE